jgi:hypothetical protein
MTKITMRRRRAAGAAICQGCARGRLVPGSSAGLGLGRGIRWEGVEVEGEHYSTVVEYSNLGFDHVPLVNISVWEYMHP